MVLPIPSLAGTRRLKHPARTGRPEILGLCFAILFCAAGCHRDRYEIALLDDAQSQFLYAQKQYEVYSSPFNKDESEKYARIAIASYQKVIVDFPKERIYVNRSKLAIALIHDLEKREKKALKAYEKLLETCPDDDVIQINALFSAARIHDEKKDFEKAKEYYRRIIEHYGDSKDPKFQSLVRGSRYHYGKVREL